VNPVVEQLYSKHLFDLMDYVSANYELLDVTAVMTRMLVDLKICHAVTDTGFIKWAHAYVRRTADDLLDSQVSTLEDVVALARSRDTELKPAFIAEQHPTRPEVTFVLIERGKRAAHAVWIVPTDKLGLVQILHPTVKVKFTRIANRRYPYLVKHCQQQTYNGSWRTVERDLLAIWLGTDWPISARDSNYLNYLPENLRICHPISQDALDRAIHELWPDKDTLDWKPDAPTAVPRNDDDNPMTKPPSAHDVKVNRWLHDKAPLKFDAALEAQVAKEAMEASEEKAATLPVDQAARRLREAWGVNSLDSTSYKA
jgi:hypothetical protein